MEGLGPGILEGAVIYAGGGTWPTSVKLLYHTLFIMPLIILGDQGEGEEKKN